ncbi:hypothetical protein CIHG_08843 [Coccidioides immitis H538.4]|uniref:Uncharacterized protein n=1 Tax=Coccidioides immitis H538.4 TaxID=396776 RepID=A0A0J8UTD1_COCIT|nr:hypothetical protein CIHG_08843 [Coccidioides immitis H538.4]
MSDKVNTNMQRNFVKSCRPPSTLNKRATAAEYDKQWAVANGRKHAETSHKAVGQAEILNFSLPMQPYQERNCFDVWHCLSGRSEKQSQFYRSRNSCSVLARLAICVARTLRSGMPASKTKEKQGRKE